MLCFDKILGYKCIVMFYKIVYDLMSSLNIGRIIIEIWISIDGLSIVLFEWEEYNFGYILMLM